MDLMSILGDVFELVVRSGCVSRLRSGTRLDTMLQNEEERDPRKRQKYEAIMEELGNVREAVKISCMHIHAFTVSCLVRAV